MKKPADTLLNLLYKKVHIGRNLGALDFLINFYANKLLLRSVNEVHSDTKCHSEKYARVIPLLQSNLPLDDADAFSAVNVAINARKAQMLETFLSALQAALSPDKPLLQGDEKKLLLNQVKNAFLLSQDSDFLVRFFERYPECVSQLSLPAKIHQKLPQQLQQLIEVDHKIDAIVFDQFDNPDWLAIQQVSHFSNWQHKIGLSINKAQSEAEFLAAWNALFQRFNLLPAISAKPIANALSSFQFEPAARVSGELVSVIMACFNAEDTIEYAICSLLNQTYENIELLICDDGSDDSTLDIITRLAKHDKRICLYSSSANQGTYNIRNKLISYAKGRFITFHDADDLAHPMRIKRQVQHLLDNKLLVSSCRWLRLSESGKVNFFYDGQMVKFCVVSTMLERAVFGIIPAFRSVSVAADSEFYENCIYYLGEQYVGILEQPLILGLWSDNSLTKLPELSAENTGYVAIKRRQYSEIVAQQRVFGCERVSDETITTYLKDLKIYRQPQEVIPKHSSGFAY